jgi:hypothetical protein
MKFDIIITTSFAAYVAAAPTVKIFVPGEPTDLVSRRGLLGNFGGLKLGGKQGASKAGAGLGGLCKQTNIFNIGNNY